MYYLQLDTKIKRVHFYLAAFVAIFFVIAFIFRPFFTFGADSVGEMNKKIEKNKDDIDSLNKKLGIYQQKITEARKQTRSLKSELTILDDEIEKNNIDIQITEKQIQKTNLEIQKITLAIDEQEKEIKKKKKYLEEFIRLIYKNDQVSHLEIFLMNDSFSQFFDHYEYLENIQDKIRITLNEIKNLKANLELQKSTLEDKKKREVELKEELDIKKGELGSKSLEKETVLRETKRSELKFQSYVEDLKKEQAAINNEIVSLEKKVREELEKRKKEEKFKSLGSARLQWPIPGRQITAFFHDPEYPYRHIFEHPAIDIRSPQATPILAAEAGYVGQIKNGGRKGYSYIMLIHGDGLSTVYGHVSAIQVSLNKYVNKGDKIGLTGGMPGTVGAGPLTTGPHLHFEVRKNGIPVNPLDYLP